MIGEVTAISLDHNLKFTDGSSIEGEFELTGSYKLTEASRIEEKFDYKIPADIVLGEKLDLSTTKVEIDDFYYEIANDDSLICYIDVKVEGVEEIEMEPQAEAPQIEEQEEKKVKEEQIPVELNQIIPEVEVVRIDEDEPKLEESIIKKELEENIVRECDGDNTYMNEKNDLPECKQDLPSIEKYQEPPREKTNVKETEEVVVEKIINEEQTVGSLFSSLKDSDETFSTYSVYILRQEESVASLIEKYKTTKEELESYNDLSNLTIGTKIIIPVHNE